MKGYIYMKEKKEKKKKKSGLFFIAFCGGLTKAIRRGRFSSINVFTRTLWLGNTSGWEKKRKKKEEKIRRKKNTQKVPTLHSGTD